MCENIDQPKEQQPMHAGDVGRPHPPVAASVSVDELHDIFTRLSERLDIAGASMARGVTGAKTFWVEALEAAESSVKTLIAAQPPDHSGCLKREEVEAAIGENEELLPEEEKMSTTEWCRKYGRNNLRKEIRQKLGLSGSQEPSHNEF